MIQVIPLSSPKSFNLLDASIAEINQALEFGALTSQELVQLYFDRINAYDFNAPLGEGAQPLNTILALNENALAIAKTLDEERRQGNIKSPLHGIPVLLKDNIDTADQPTTAGSVALEGSTPPDDAFITANLREAGAVIIGKGSLTEFANYLANGMPAGYSSLNGYTFNPYNPTLSTTVPDGRPALSPGGSSAGSAAAVAASLVPVSVGSETNGSILSPGNQNSVVGIKPTVGLVSRDGIIPIAASQDTAGPFGKTVADAAALLGLLTGVDPNDPITSTSEGKAFTDYTQFLDDRALEGKRIGVPKTVFWEGLTDEQRAITERAIAVLESQGATIVYVEIPTARELATAPNTTVLDYEFKRDLNAYLSSLGPDAPVKTLSDVIAFNAANPEVALKYGQARALSGESKDISPGSADTIAYLAARANDLRLTKDALDAYLSENELDAVLFSGTRGANIGARAGYPSIILPAGYLSNGTATPTDDAPYGVALLGTAYSEPTLIALGYDYEQASQVRVAPASTPGLPGETFEYLTGVLVVGTSGSDVIVPEELADFDGNGDTVYALGGDDTIDTRSSVSGGNQIFAGEGDDSVTVGRNDIVSGGEGNDRLTSNESRGGNTIAGDAGNDLFNVGRNDRLLGGEGDDQFYVGVGEGDNLITGGAGADQFWIANDVLPLGANTITDFEIGKDVIGIARLGIDFAGVSQTQTEGGLLLSAFNTDLALLQGITAPLDASNFAFA
ncbi:amidase family protein [Leptolyngbya ohadii]|uniref:amidase family protein n=1 Tax=Leptolyngbya ohadii TaxID=1962290 RepID=UPI000B59D0DF|nr:amidase family protein [Leptolyngbya ohadii]